MRGGYGESMADNAPSLEPFGKVPDRVVGHITPSGKHLILVVDGVLKEYDDYNLSLLTDTDGSLWLEIEISGKLAHRFRQN